MVFNDIIIQAQLEPLAPFLKRSDLIELSAIEAGGVGLELEGQGYEWQDAPELTYTYWRELCHALANNKGLSFNPESHPRIATALPGGHRFEATLGNTVESGLSVSIRMNRPTVVELEEFGLAGDLKAELIKAVERSQTILISGGTSSGKTTFLNRLIKYIPLTHRILTVEDTRELRIPHVNHVNYVISTPSSSVDYPQMIDHLMRSRPDVIITGELSTHNAYPILRLLNTGHGGFMCTVHANSPELVLDEAIPANIRLSGKEIPGAGQFLRKTVDIVIQLHKVASGKRAVTEIWFPKTDHKIKLSEGELRHAV